jgi:hypothetical protein
VPLLVAVPELWNTGLRLQGSIEIDVVIPPENPAAPIQLGKPRLVGLEPGVLKKLKEETSTTDAGDTALKLKALGVLRVVRVGHVWDYREKLTLTRTAEGTTAINYMNRQDRKMLAARALGKTYDTAWAYDDDASLDKVSDAELQSAADALVDDALANATVDQLQAASRRDIND